MDLQVQSKEVSKGKDFVFTESGAKQKKLMRIDTLACLLKFSGFVPFATADIIITITVLLL
jgi:hypothetical protein